MNHQLAALLLVLLVPLFVGSWRVSLLGLALQGLLTDWIACRLQPDAQGFAAWLRWSDLFVVRGVLVPWLLLRVLRAQQVRARLDVIPPNLLAWSAAIALVLFAFHGAERLLPAAGPPQLLVATAATGVLLALLVLATQPGVFGQIVGVLRLENAIALFELGGPGEDHGVVAPLGHALLFVATVALMLRYLAALGAAPGAPAPGDTL